jgi:hypothetical protein
VEDKNANHLTKLLWGNLSKHNGLIEAKIARIKVICLGAYGLIIFQRFEDSVIV